MRNAKLVISTAVILSILYAVVILSILYAVILSGAKNLALGRIKILHLRSE